MKASSVRRVLLDCLLMVALATLFALTYELFIARNQFAPAGISGVATMVELSLIHI